MQKDLCLKRYFSDKRRFADLINGFIADGQQIITAADLDDRGSQSESIETQKYRDRLYKAAFGVNFIMIGLEGQDEIHYGMPQRCMWYDAAEYDRQAAEIRRALKNQKGLTSAERLSGFRAVDRLMPCVTLVLYFGDDWDGARSMHELLDFTDIPDALRPLINDYPMHIMEVRKLTDTSMFHTDVKQVFDAVRFSKDRVKFRELIYTDPAYRSLDIEAYDMIVKYTGAGELKKLRESCRKGEKIDMCEALAMMIKEEREQGILQGTVRSVVAVLKRLAPVPEDIAKRINAESDLTVLTTWLELAAEAESIEEFKKAIDREAEKADNGSKC